MDEKPFFKTNSFTSGIGLLRELKRYRIKDEELHLNNSLIDFINRLKQSSGFIGNDSGLSHLSAFIGVPVIAIFGPSDPIRWRPVGPAVAVVEPEIDCRPCFELEQKNCDSIDCLNSISPKQVIGILKKTKALKNLYRS